VFPCISFFQRLPPPNAVSRTNAPPATKAKPNQGGRVRTMAGLQGVEIMFHGDFGECVGDFFPPPTPPRLLAIKAPNHGNTPPPLMEAPALKLHMAESPMNSSWGRGGSANRSTPTETGNPQQTCAVLKDFHHAGSTFSEIIPD